MTCQFLFAVSRMSIFLSGEGLALGIRECFMESVKQIENLGVSLDMQCIVLESDVKKGSVDLVSCKTFDLGLPAYYVIALSEASR